MSYETLIDVDSLRRLPGPGDLAVVDCRFDLAKAEAGWLAFQVAHIPGARYAHLNRDLSAPVTADSGRHPLPDAGTLAATLTSLGIGNTTQVVAYDEANGAFAARLWWLLRWLGHSKVAVLDGGFKTWVAHGLPVEIGKVAPPPQPAVPFEAHIEPARVLDTAAVESGLRDARRLLIDARAPERFAGDVEPIDPVAGHVPGAINHPFADNLQSDGRFLPTAELRRRWEARLAGRPPVEVAVMCGSGVTACHNLLSLEVAGLRGAKLYAGSWSEWIRDPRRGVARGA